MATKKELIEDIHAIDPDADTAGLKHAELEVLLMKVKEEAEGGSDDSADEAPEGGSDDSADEAPKAEEPKPVKKASPASGKVIGNAREQGACRVAGIQLEAKGQEGDSVELSIEQLQDQNLMSKIARNIGSGLLEWR
jgi:hypothetical protein